MFTSEVVHKDGNGELIEKDSCFTKMLYNLTTLAPEGQV